MAESIISVETKKSINITTTSTYVKNISNILVGSTLYIYMQMNNTVPADQFAALVLSFPNNGKSLRVTTPATLQIASSQDVRKTVTATLSTNGGVSIRLSDAFAYDFYLYFVTPYY